RPSRAQYPALLFSSHTPRVQVLHSPGSPWPAAVDGTCEARRRQIFLLPAQKFFVADPSMLVLSTRGFPACLQAKSAVCESPRHGTYPAIPAPTRDSPTSPAI